MIIGVGNDQFTWMYRMGFGVPRAFGGIHVCIPNVVMQIRRAGMGFKATWGDVSLIKFAFFSVLPAPSMILESTSPLPCGWMTRRLPWSTRMYSNLVW